MRRPAPTLPAGPLLDALDRRGVVAVHHGHALRKAVSVARRTGRVTVWQADRLAIAMLDLQLELLYGPEALETA